MRAIIRTISITRLQLGTSYGGQKSEKIRARVALTRARRAPCVLQLFSFFCFLQISFLPAAMRTVVCRRSMSRHMPATALPCLCLAAAIHSGVSTSFVTNINSAFLKTQPNTTSPFRGGASTMSLSTTTAAVANHTSVDAVSAEDAGAINEKKRSLVHSEQPASPPSPSGYDPIRNRAHMMHALEGMDRYPNYLSRWSREDMDRLEQGLEHQLAQVRDKRDPCCKDGRA